jgi:hypothetical protein
MPSILRNISIRKDHRVLYREKYRLGHICISISSGDGLCGDTIRLLNAEIVCHPSTESLSPQQTPLPPSKVCTLISQNDILVVFRDDEPSYCTVYRPLTPYIDRKVRICYQNYLNISSDYDDYGVLEHPRLLGNREYCTIYREPGFLVVFGSSPTPPPLPSVGSTGDT